MPAFTSQIGAQKFIMRMVARGYRHWTSGKVTSKDELDKLHHKYRDLFGCDLSPAKKAYRKKCGLANTHFVFAPLPIEEMEGGFIWFLLATDGEGEIRKHGRMKDGWDKNGRVTFGDYVLHLAPRHRLEGGGLRWSWYIVPTIQRELEYYIRQCLKSAPGELAAFFEAQTRRPMHHGVRHYLSRLIKRAHQSFSKMHPGRKWTARDPSTPLPIINSF